MRDFPVFDVPDRSIPEFDIPRFHVPVFMATSATMRELLRTYFQFRPALKKSTRDDYTWEVDKFLRWAGVNVSCSELSDELLAAYLEHLLKIGPATSAKKSRSTLLALWRFAYRKRLCDSFPRDVPQIPTPRLAPQAWTPDQIYRILDACSSANSYSVWNENHWKALILTIYDTSLRIGALLATPLSAFDPEMRTLLTAAEHQKQNQEQIHRLHPQTAQAIAETIDGPREKLFPWPLLRRQIWIHFRKIVTAAGLPCTRRDMFHKIRRTSYTLTHAALGGQAATDHAGHSADLSAHYLDKELWRLVSNAKSPADVIPRPSGPELRLYVDPDRSAGAG